MLYAPRIFFWMNVVVCAALTLYRVIASSATLEIDLLRVLTLRKLRHRDWLRVAGCFLDQLYARAQVEFGVDVGEVGLHGAR